MLTQSDEAILELERQRFKYQGAKEGVILSRFGSVVHYYQQLNKLLDAPEAIAHDPILIGRLRQRRVSRER